MSATAHATSRPQTVVVIGNGMVGQRFCEKLVEFDAAGQYRIVTFCEEPRAAYDRVGLTSFFAHRDAEKLMLARRDWYADHGVELHMGDRAAQIDRENAVVRSDKGVEDRLRRRACWPPARFPSCRRCRASTSAGCLSIARSKTSNRSSTTPSRRERVRGHRRRLARAGSGQGGL